MKNFTLEDRQVVKDGKYVLRTGKIFEAGDYPDKKFRITTEELKTAAKQFTPVKLDLEHKSTVLDGKIGSLEFVEATENGELVGSALVPAWLDDMLGGKYKVSATWSGDKQLTGLAIVKNPRISDAALFTAYNFSNPEDESIESILFEMARTWDGRSTIQQIHDLCARTGAICDEENESEYPNYYYSKIDSSVQEAIEFVSKDESKTIQKLHDLAMKAGAKCSFVKESHFSGASGTLRGITMSKLRELKDALFSVLNAVPDEEVITENKEFSQPATAVTPKDSAEQDNKLAAELEAKAKEAEFSKQEADKLRAEVEALKQQNKQSVEAGLSEFVKSLSGKKILPAQENEVSMFFKQLLEDDEKVEYKFSVGDSSFSRVDFAKKIFSELNNLELTQEKTFSGEAQVLGTNDGNSDHKALEAATRAYIAKKNPTIK